MPIGRLIRKIHRHPKLSVRYPPSTGPRAGAATVGIDRIADARARSSGGNARKSRVIPTGVSIPPPTPWANREAINMLIELASLHISEAPIKIDSANMNVCFVPKRSPTQPDTGIHTARLSE